MFYASWVYAIIALNGQQDTGSITRELAVTQAECTAYIDKVERVMPDYIRGWTHSDPEVEVLVRGNCVPTKTDPAL